jgi:hypothetical protein
VAVFTCQDNGPAGRADAVRAKTVCEADAFFCDPVDIGGLIDPAPVGTHGMCGMVIRHHKDDVRPGGGRDDFVGSLTSRTQNQNYTKNCEKQDFYCFHNPSNFHSLYITGIPGCEIKKGDNPLFLHPWKEVPDPYLM